MSLDHFIEAESKEVWNLSPANKQTNKKRKTETKGWGHVEGTPGANLKELPMATAGTIRTTKQLDYNLKYKMNVHEFILNNLLLNK